MPQALLFFFGCKLMCLVSLGLLRFLFLQFLFLRFFCFFSNSGVLVCRGCGGSGCSLLRLCNGSYRHRWGLCCRCQWQSQGGCRQKRNQKFVHGFNVLKINRDIVSSVWWVNLTHQTHRQARERGVVLRPMRLGKARSHGCFAYASGLRRLCRL